MPWPTFLLIGAPRAGTTALYAALYQHPQLSLSRIKEPDFFAYGELETLPFQGPAAAVLARRIVATQTAYLALFPPAPNALARGEGSMTNWLPRAHERICAYVPTAKLIVILRHPVDRAYSHFVYARQRGWEPLADFAAALAADPARRAQGWIPYLWYNYYSAYAARLAPFLATFPRHELRIYRGKTFVSFVRTQWVPASGRVVNFHCLR